MNKRWLTTVLVLMILALLACVSTTPLPPGSLAYATFTPSPLSAYDQDGAYAAAQATLASGQNEVMALSHQATVVSLSMDQAADAAAQATIDYDERRLMELSIRGTEVSLNMARAAATQQAIQEQAQLAQNATATAQSQAATATAHSQAVAATAHSQAATATAHSQAVAATATVAAYNLRATETVQARAILVARAEATAQAQATQTAYPLTATPAAATQAYVERSRDRRERRALWDEFVITPMTTLLSAVIIILIIVGGVIIFRRLMPIVEFRLRNPYGDRTMPPRSLIEGTIVDLDPYDYRLEQPDQVLLNHPQLTGDETPQIEIIDPSDPSIINWVAEAERKLRTAGRTPP
jgi:hypothetical protein